MNSALKISADWERLDAGGAEERSCFAAVGIQAHGVWLTEGRDSLANRLRQAPLLSAYHLAEWFAWNWWRLRWEARAPNAAMEWRLAHKMSNIGGGYVWPNIAIFSDGERTVVAARPSKEKLDSPFRYIADVAVAMPSSDFESAIDAFIEQVLGRLDAENLKVSNLSRLWSDVCAERKNPDLRQRRKLEALMGYDPEEGGEQLVARLMSDANILGMSAVEELAADCSRLLGQSPPSATDLAEIAETIGFRIDPRNMAKWTRRQEPPRHRNPAWKIGADAAKALRAQEKLGDGPISDERLTQMLAVDIKSLKYSEAISPGFSFILENPDGESRLTLRPKWHSGRRFELSRLLGDRLMSADAGLFPATRTDTYRQKAQRAFAAELLSPFDALVDMLRGDYSAENLSDVAAQFQVSELTVRTQLVNHRVLEREDLEAEFDVAQAIAL